MTIELVFRAGYFAVSLLLIFYTRALLTSSVVLAVAAWVAYGHPASNSGGQEVLVFFITWLVATLTASVIGYAESSSWVIDLEWKLMLSVRAKYRSQLRVHDAVSWLFACMIAAAAYATTEMTGYDKNTFHRVPSMGALLLISIIVYGADQISSSDDYRILPAGATYLHPVVTLVVELAFFVDILVRDPGFWVYLVPITLVWLAFQAPKVLLWMRPRVGSGHKKSE